MELYLKDTLATMSTRRHMLYTNNLRKAKQEIQSLNGEVIKEYHNGVIQVRLPMFINPRFLKHSIPCGLTKN